MEKPNFLKTTYDWRQNTKLGYLLFRGLSGRPGSVTHSQSIARLGLTFPSCVYLVSWSWSWSWSWYSYSAHSHCLGLVFYVGKTIKVSTAKPWPHLFISFSLCPLCGECLCISIEMFNVMSTLYIGPVSLTKPSTPYLHLPGILPSSKTFSLY